MNSNLIRSILNILTGGTLTSIFTSVLGCSGDSLATASCKASFIPLQYQAAAGVVFVVIGFLLKSFGGSGATVAQNLAAPVVPVVPIVDAKPGVVTAAQVSSASPVK